MKSIRYYVIFAACSLLLFTLKICGRPAELDLVGLGWDFHPLPLCEEADISNATLTVNVMVSMSTCYSDISGFKSQSPRVVPIEWHFNMTFESLITSTYQKSHNIVIIVITILLLLLILISHNMPLISLTVITR